MLFYKQCLLLVKVLTNVDMEKMHIVEMQL
jgi:hypothetical protein